MAEQVLPDELISIIADNLEQVPTPGLLYAKTVNNDTWEQHLYDLEIRDKTGQYILIQYVRYDFNLNIFPIEISCNSSSVQNQSKDYRYISPQQMLQELQLPKNAIQKWLLLFDAASPYIDLYLKYQLKLKVIDYVIETILTEYMFLKHLIKCKNC